MKNPLVIALLLSTNLAYAQEATPINTEQFEKIKTILPEKIFDKKEFEDFDANKAKLFELNVTANKDYLNGLVTSSDTEVIEQLKNPSVIMEAVEAKNDLENGGDINVLEEYQQYMSQNVAAEAKFPLVGGSASSERNIYVIQYIAYKEFPKNSGKYLGYGLYMTLDTSSLGGEASTSLPYLVASATVNNKSFTRSTKLVGFEGLGAHKLLRNAMPGSNFDIDTYVGYESFKKALIEGLENKTLKISPVPIQPINEIGKLAADSLALARVYALRSVYKRLTLSQALEGHNDQTTNALSIIKEVYIKHAGLTKYNERPSKINSEKAEKLIKHLGIQA